MANKIYQMLIILNMQLCLSKRNFRFDKNTASPAWPGLGRYRTIDFSIWGLGVTIGPKSNFFFIVQFDLGGEGVGSGQGGGFHP